MSDRDTTEERSGVDGSETNEDRFLPGTVVVDSEDPEPAPAIVINRPPCTCEEWVAYRDAETDREVTVAEDNPEYDPESDLVVVAFKETLEEQDPEKLPVDEPVSLGELNCRHYGFPKGRLEIIEGAETSVATQLDDSTDRKTSSSESKSETRSEDNDPESVSDQFTPGKTAGVGGGEESVRSEKRELSAEFEALRDRVADSATVSVEWDGTTPQLSVQKLGTTYQIFPDG